MSLEESNQTAGSCVANGSCNKKVYLVLYGEGFLRPDYGPSHNTGLMFKLSAEARYKKNKEKYPNAEHYIFLASIDQDFFNILNRYKNIIRLDIYSHAWFQLLNLGGFTGTRKIKTMEKQKKVVHETYWVTETCWLLFDCEVKKTRSKTIEVEVEVEKEVESADIDWDNSSKANDLRWVSGSELNKINSDNFESNQKTYLWGCNVGGQLDFNGTHILCNDCEIEGAKDPKLSFANSLAKQLGKGKVYALVGKGAAGGSMFKADSKGNAVYDGELIPANIAYNHEKKNTDKLNAEDYFKEFPL